MRNQGLAIAMLALVAAAAIGLYGVRSFLKKAPDVPGLSSAPSEAPSIPANLPPLEESDGLVRLRAGALSSDPAFQRWLEQESLLARLASSMSMLADGKVPRETFAAFAPRGKFRVVKKDGKAFTDPAAHARYDGFAAMAGRVDAVAAAKIFTELEPLFDAAQRGLGEKNPRAREAFFAAARELLAAPVSESEPALKEGKKGVGWAYADESLENLSPARKQLMRMGPKNQAAVQAKIRAVALALGAAGLPQ